MRVQPFCKENLSQLQDYSSYRVVRVICTDPRHKQRQG